MIKEQKEAIERLNKFEDIAILYGKTFAMTLGQLKTLQGDIETVLNMLKENSEEIETLKRDFKIVDQECSRLERKEAKQDKIIDLMAETIRKLAISLANYKGSYNKETINFTGNTKDIKKYFEQEATKMSQERKEEWKKKN